MKLDRFRTAVARMVELVTNSADAADGAMDVADACVDQLDLLLTRLRLGNVPATSELDALAFAIAQFRGTSASFEDVSERQARLLPLVRSELFAAAGVREL